MKRSLCLTVAVASLAAGSVFADTFSPSADWTVKMNEPTWWFASPTTWTLTTNGSTKREGTFPEANDAVKLGDWHANGTTVYLQDGDHLPAEGGSFLYLGVAYGFTAGTFTLEIRKGASICVRGTKNSNYEYVRLGDDKGTDGRLFVKGGILDCNNIYVGGGAKNTSTAHAIGKGWLYVSDGGCISNDAALTVTGTQTSRVDIVNSTYTSPTTYGDWNLGGDRDDATWRSPVTVSNSLVRFRSAAVHGTADLRMTDTLCDYLPNDWSANSCSFTMTGNPTQTNLVHLVNSRFFQLHPEWHDASPYSRQFDRWLKIGMRSKGYSEFIQENSVVTNSGVWFWPAQNAGNVYPIKPPRYVVKGGDLYVYSGSNNGDSLKGYPNGVATHGFCAFTNAPNSGTISLVDAPKVSYPRVCTNVLVSGQGQDANPRVFGVTAYRPHFEFVLTKKGHRPMEIREQTDILGMFSVVPQGGLQVVQTNRLALIRHKTASKTLATLDEPQFRAPNGDLWTTGGFADTPCEWGVTLKPEAEIASGEDLGDGVASGFVKLPRCNPEKLLKGQLRLKLAPAVKTVAEAVADLNAAGYPTTLEGTDEAVVDLVASGMLAKGAANTVLLDFNAPQDAVGVRDNVKTANVRILGATTDIVGQGLSIILR